MFLRAAKVALVEALRATFDVDPDHRLEDEDAAYEGFRPRSVSIEYPEEEMDWPAIFVQFHPEAVSWTGINPDEYLPTMDDDRPWQNIRRGQFEGNFDLMILALTSAERDRMWDELVELVLMGDMRSDTNRFHQALAHHDLISMTIQRAQVRPVGDSVGAGVPWDGNRLAYEATLRLQVTGQFAADAFNRELIAFQAITVHPYSDIEVPYGEDDGEGPWL